MGAVLVELVARTLEYVAIDALDHYAVLEAGDRLPGLRSDALPEQRANATRDLLLFLAANPGAHRFPFVHRSGTWPWMKLTRVVIRLGNGDLVLIAVRGWLTDIAARALADRIEAALWKRRSPVVVLPDPSWYLSGHYDGLGTPPVTTASLAFNSWQRRASARLRVRG